MLPPLYGKTHYRQQLGKALTQQGFVFKFVGPAVDGVSHYAAFHGQTFHELQRTSGQLFRQYPADIVLLNISRSLLPMGSAESDILQDFQQMIQRFQQMNPSVTVIIAQIIPAAGRAGQDYLPALNKALIPLAQQLSTVDSHIVIVHQNDSLQGKVDLTTDHRHLTATGIHKVLSQWIQAITPFLY